MKKLTELTIGSNVKTIGSHAFDGCKKLKKITISTKSLKTVGDNAFSGIHKKAVVLCPKAKVKLYRSLLLAAGLPKTASVKKK